MSNVPTSTFAATKYVKVSFNSEGGTTVTSKKVVYHKLIPEPKAPKKTGYSFGGWYKDSKLKTAWNFKKNYVTSNITLYAKWNPNIYKVSFNSVKGSSVAYQKVKYKGLVSIPKKPTKVGNSFAGWYKDAKYKTSWNFGTSRVTSNITLYAKWTANKYTIQFDTQGGSKVASKTVTYNGMVSAPPSPTKTGYSFAGWYTSPNVLTSWNFSSKIFTSRTLYARWKSLPQSSYLAIIPYTVGSLNIRSAPNTLSTTEILGTLTGNAIVYVSTCSTDGWYQINYKNKTAYICKTFGNGSNITTVQLVSYASIVTATGGAAIYEKASASSKIVSTLDKGDYVNVIPIPGNYDFVQASDSNGKIGYILISNLQQLFYDTVDIHKPSAVTASQLDAAIANYKAKNNIKSSIMDGQGKTFIEVGNASGINPLILAAIAFHESAWGTNNLAIMKKNIYSIAAFDGSAFESAYTFRSVKEAIQYEADLLNKTYFNTSFSNNSYAAGDFIGTGGLKGVWTSQDKKYNNKYQGAAGINYYYSSNANWGADIASICQMILPYNITYYNNAKPMVVKSLNNISLLSIDHDFAKANLSITGKFRGLSPLHFYKTLGGLTEEDYKRDVDGTPIQLVPTNSTANPLYSANSFKVLNLYGNAWNGWMQISITTTSNVTYTGFVNFGGLSDYKSRFTLDNLMRKLSDGTYAEQPKPYTTVPTGYTTCYR